jgi:hypothetical protein
VSGRRPSRVPPYDENAERSLLGACLLKAEAITRAIEVVSPEDFYRPAHALVFDAVLALHIKGAAVDPTTVAAELAQAGQLELAGGLAELISLQSDTPSTGNAGRYAGIVADRSLMRRFIAVGGEIAEMGYSMPEDLDAAAERAHELLGRLNGAGRSPLVIRSFADIEQEPVEWVWQDRIPRRAVTIMAGDPGVGKSFVAIALAAGLSVGAALPGAKAIGPTGTIIVSYEDAAEVTLKARIKACAADQRLIFNLDGVADGIGLRAFRPDDSPRLERELERRPEVGLVVVDPVGSLLAGKLDMGRDNEVRGALQPLVDLADRRNVAVLAVMHLRKEDTARVIYRVGGSMGGFVGLARSVLVVCKEEASGRRAVTHPKCNVGRETESVEYVLGADGTFAWKGVAKDLSAEEMLASGQQVAETKRDQAGEWLTKYLRSHGHVRRDDVYRAGRRRNFSPGTLRRAFGDIGADSVQIPEPGRRGPGPSYWFLPEDAQPPSDPG